MDRGDFVCGLRYRQKLLDEFAGLRIVQAYHAVKPGRGNLLTVGMKANRVDGPVLTLKSRDPFAVAGLVDPDLTLAVETAAHRQEAAVTVKAACVNPARHPPIFPDLVSIVSNHALRLAVHFVKPRNPVRAPNQ